MSRIKSVWKWTTNMASLLKRWKVAGGGIQLVGWLMTPHSTLKWEVCRCKYTWIMIYIYVYIFSQTMCTEIKRRYRQIEAYDRSQKYQNHTGVCWCGRRRGSRARGYGGGDSVPPKETHCPSNSRGREVWGVEWVSGGRRGHGGGAGWAGWGFEGSQGPVPGLVFSQNVLAAAQLLPQVRYLQAESGVLLLQEGGADGNLVLLQPPGVPWPLGCHVVLSAPGPVLIILRRTVGTGWGGQESELKKTVNTALNVMPVPDPSTRGRQWFILTAESLCFSLFSVICTQLKGWMLIFNVLTNNDALNTKVLVPFPTFGSVWCHK